MKILCIEDDINLRKLLQTALVRQNYQVDLAEDGERGLELAKDKAYKLILLDLVLPKISGMDLCKILRSEQALNITKNRDTPVILMTALEAITNKVTGLDAGADDYIIKPFALEELLARIRALLRRNQSQQQVLKCLSWGGLNLNPNNCEVSYHGELINLSKKEYEILQMFLQNPQQIFSHNYILELLWAVEEMPTQGALRAHIKGLRNKLKVAGVGDILETIYKLGYKLKVLSVIDESPTILNPQIVETVQLIEYETVSNSNVIPELLEIWQHSRQSYLERLLVIQEAVMALEQGRLTLKQQYEAQTEAHTLIGSLGSFGLDKASEISRQIQQILHQQKLVEENQTEQLKLLVAQLQNYIKGEELVLSSAASNPYRLLIIDNEIGLVEEIAKEAINHGFITQITSNLKQIEDILTNSRVDAILLDVNFQNNQKIGLDFLVSLRKHKPKIPILIVTQEGSFATRLEVSKLGISCFLLKPIATSEIWISLKQIMQRTHLSSYRLLVVDDDPGILQVVSQLLSSEGYQIVLLEEAEKFWEILEQTKPDLLILDIELLNQDKSKQYLLNGFDLCQVIRNDWRWSQLPVLFLSAHTDRDTIERSFAVGGNDFLSKPIIATQLQARVRKRLEQRQR